jgi:hypothetical protein
MHPSSTPGSGRKSWCHGNRCRERIEEIAQFLHLQSSTGSKGKGHHPKHDARVRLGCSLGCQGNSVSPSSSLVFSTSTSLVCGLRVMGTPPFTRCRRYSSLRSSSQNRTLRPLASRRTSNGNRALVLPKSLLSSTSQYGYFSGEQIALSPGMGLTVLACL